LAGFQWNGEIGANPMLWRNCDLDEEARRPFAVVLALYETWRTDRYIGWRACFLFGERSASGGRSASYIDSTTQRRQCG